MLNRNYYYYFYEIEKIERKKELLLSIGYFKSFSCFLSFLEDNGSANDGLFYIVTNSLHES